MVGAIFVLEIKEGKRCVNLQSYSCRTSSINVILFLLNIRDIKDRLVKFDKDGNGKRKHLNWYFYVQKATLGVPDKVAPP